jgi:transposase-like protein
MSYLNAPHLHDEAKAYAFVEALVWPQGRVCPHCGVVGESSAMKGKSTRIGTYKCYACRKPFTVKIGTIFESSHVKLHLWLQAIFLIASSKKGISSNQLHRTLGVTLKTAWFMSHRIREAMRSDSLSTFGSGGGGVEVDETFIGREPGKAKARSGQHKMKVLSLVDRTTGEARSMVVDKLTMKEITPILTNNISREASVLTDEAAHYTHLKHVFASHDAINHSKGEYVRYGQPTIHTNTVEGFFSVFKRGMKGTYQHCGKQHLHRYLAEFDFRYSNRKALGVDDDLRTEQIVQGVVGKRLTYKAAGGTDARA